MPEHEEPTLNKAENSIYDEDVRNDPRRKAAFDEAQPAEEPAED